jgi:acetyl-CoA carboxylase biotin carboxyl carrier protein
MVGKFYAAPSPSDPPYVQEGARVEAGATVGLIEVMKVFTSIKTETAGVVERILVGNGEFVEYGQALLLIRSDPSSGDKGAP